MKNLLIILLAIISINVSGQCDPDIEPPTFDLPMYLTDGIIYDCLDSVPPLTDMTDQAVMDLVFATLVDNCLSTDVPPWYGPTLSAGILNQTDTSVIYTFTASDDGPNYYTQQMIFYFTSLSCQVDSCLNDTTPPTFQPYPPALIQIEQLSDLVLPVIEGVDNCSEASVSYVLTEATGCATLECYAIEWFVGDESGNFAIAFTMIEVGSALSVLEHEPRSSLKVYPNPSNGQFTVESEEPYRIYDLSGREVFQDQMTSGSYIIRTETESLQLIIHD